MSDSPGTSQAATSVGRPVPGRSAALCKRCASPLAAEDQRCVICGLPLELSQRASEASAETGGKIEVQVVRCTACNAAMRYDVKLQAPSCAFCGSVTRLEAPLDPPERPEAALPFDLDPEQATQALRVFLSRGGLLRPSDLRESARLSALTPLWWVGWVCNAEARVSWAADSDAGADKASWAPHTGQQDVTLEKILVSASKGLGQDEVRQLASAYRLEEALPWQGEDAQQQASSPKEPGPDKAPAGTVVESFETPRSAARARVLQAIQQLAHARARAQVPGRKLRNLKVATRLSRLNTRRLLFPVYVLAYRYHDTLYRVIVHGQDPRCVIGKTPLSIAKLLALIGGSAAALLLLLWLGFGR